MARKRNLSPEFWTDPKITKLSRDARLLFIGLISNANDYGKLRGTPSTIRSKIFPEDVEVSLETIEDWLNQMAALKLIIRYNIGGEPFVYILNWPKHQPLHNPSKDEFSDPPKDLLKAITGKESSGMVLEQLGRVYKPAAYIYVFNILHKKYIGIDYLVYYSRDTKIMKDIVDTYKDEELIKSLMEEFFKWGEDPKSWYYEKGRTIPIFKGSCAQLLQRLRKK